MNRRKNWTEILAIALFLMVAVELFQQHVLMASVFGSFGVSAILMSVSLPKYQSRKEATVQNLAYLALATAIILYAIKVIVARQEGL